MTRLTTQPSGTGKSYYLDGEKIPGVTTILNALPGPPPSWGAQEAAKFAVDNWEELNQEAISNRLAVISKAADYKRDTAAARGTEIHHYAELLQSGEPVEIPEEHRGPIEAFVKFLDAWDITPVATETPLAHTVHKYGGTADLWCRIGARDNATALVDLKSGNTVPGKTALQLTGYRQADLWQPNGPESETTKPDVDLVYVAHIGSDNVRMLPVSIEPMGLFTDSPNLRSLLYVKEVMGWQIRHDWFNRRKGEEPLIGEDQRP